MDFYVIIWTIYIMNYNLYANDKSYAIEKTWILFQSKSLRLILKKNPWITLFFNSTSILKKEIL